MADGKGEGGGEGREGEREVLDLVIGGPQRCIQGRGSAASDVYERMDGWMDGGYRRMDGWMEATDGWMVDIAGPMRQAEKPYAGCCLKKKRWLDASYAWLDAS